MSPPILIVDDDPDVRETLVEVLVEDGHSVFAAKNGLEGLAVLRRLTASPCIVVVLDVMMPVMDGPTLLRELPSIRDPSQVRIIINTGSGNFDCTGQPGVVAMLRKPFELTDLLALVKKHCS